LSLENGTKLGRYEIRSNIGEGGMVYLAEDNQLHRQSLGQKIHDSANLGIGRIFNDA
jgi:hypothetical protein